MQRINSTSERVNTLDKYVLCVASFLRTFRGASSFTLLFFIFHLLNREFIISLNKKIGIICNPRVSRCIKIFNSFQNNFDIIEISQDILENINFY